MNLSKVIILFLLSGFVSCSVSKNKPNYGANQQPSLEIAHNHKDVYYEGRVFKNDIQNATEIYWSGSSITLEFKGTSVKTIIADENGTNYFNVFIDGDFVKYIQLEKGKREYILANNLSNSKHKIALTKRNQWTDGKSLFYKFTIEGGKTYPIIKKPLFIEFYGNSITVGHGNEDYTGADELSGKVTNNYNSYAALTARKLNAEYACIARSGIGLMVSWFNMIMPEMYDLVNPFDKNLKWDFAKNQPDIVIINILQNDSWIVNLPDNAEYKRRFGNKKPSEQAYIDAYVAFIEKIKGHYPNVKIVCYLGNMDITKQESVWPARLEKVVAHFSKNVYMTSAPYIDKKGLGHPKVKDHEVSAEILTAFIKTNVLE